MSLLNPTTQEIEEKTGRKDLDGIIGKFREFVDKEAYNEALDYLKGLKDFEVRAVQICLPVHYKEAHKAKGV